MSSIPNIYLININGRKAIKGIIVFICIKYSIQHIINHQSSNLVIQKEHGTRVDEPTGEPESLAGRIDIKKMGSLANREKVKKKPQSNQPDKLFDPKKKTNVQLSYGKSVIIQDINDNLLYQPKTKENKIVYEKMLFLVHQLMPEQPQEVIKSLVDEILAVLKNENSNEKKQEVEALIGKITNEQYSDLLITSKLITDYNPEIEEGFDKYDEEVRVPVVFDEEDNQSQSSADEMAVVDEDDSDQENIQLEDGIKAKFDVIDEEVQDKYYIDQIDGYWLHAQLNNIYQDAVQSQQVQKEVLNILNSETDIECENKLVQLFTHSNFDLIKTLHNNRHKIYYSTLLGQAQSEEEKNQILNQLLSFDPQLYDSLVNPNKPKVKQYQSEDISQKIVEAIHITDADFQSLPKKTIDFDALTFHQGSHFMSNEKCHLPPGSFKLSKKGYEEIYIPAVKSKPTTDPFIKIEEMPPYSQPGFKGYKELNLIQSKVYKAAMESDQNLLICAPTGAGKTNIALLAMLQTIGAHLKSDNKPDLSKFKIVYIAPMKALVNEMVLGFQKRLEPYDMKVAELTGDTHLTKQQINQTQVLIATPEKWDILTRKANNYISLVKLIIIDEIHLLHDLRGPVLETIVSRTIRSIEERQQLVRIVGLSATLPNYSDVATFLRVQQSGLFYFDNSYRPVPLQQLYIGVTEKKAIRRMLLMNEILYDKVAERAGKNQILVFVHSRKDTVKTCKMLKEMAFSKDELSKFIKDEGVSKKVIEEVLQREEIRSNDLRELLQAGFAIHHAGMSRGDRDLVEQLFSDKHIQVLVSTSTLAWGVNLPAHTVIIKGTQIYSPEQGKWIELSPQDILQMMGRAGRPRYDTKGEGIIITSYQELKYYLSLLNMQLPIESQFISQLCDQMNAEISLGNIKSLKDGVNWLGYTYLYVRMLRNPSLYQVQEEDELLIKKRVDLIHSAGVLLDKHNLVKYDRRSGLLESTVLGRIASNYYIKYGSMGIYNQHLKQNMGLIEIMKVFSLSQEFKLVSIREEEKMELQRLIHNVPIPIKGSFDDPSTKVNVLLQSYISRLRLEGFALNSDMVYITQSAGRIMRCLFEICLKREWGQSTLNCLNLSKMVEKRMWSCMTPLRQFHGLPEEILRRIEKKEGVTWEHLYHMSSQQLGELIRYGNLGKTVHKLIHKFPRIEIQGYVQPITRSCLRIDLTLTCDFQWDEKMHGNQEPLHIFVLDSDGEKILYHEQFVMKQKRLQQQTNYQFTVTVPLFEIMHPLYFIKIVSDRWINCDNEQAIAFKNLILPTPFQRCTELLQLQQLPLENLNNKQFEQNLMKIMKCQQFDQIQTQIFQQIYENNDNIFIGSPSYQSKYVLGYLGIQNLLNQNNNMIVGNKVIYMVNNQNQQRFNDLQLLFGKQCKICQMTGQIQIDQKLLQTQDIILTTPQQWDVMSRRWRNRKGFNKIKLFICDDLHTLSEYGSILEVVVSRMRRVSTQLQDPYRIIGLSLSVADYKEICEWIGAAGYNFSPTNRTNKITLNFQSFDQSHRPTRIQVMLKNLYKQMNKQQQYIIYVSDRKQARLCALDLMAMCIADNHSFISDTNQFNQINPQVQSDTYQQYTINQGIAYLYECIDSQDESLLLSLFQHQIINVIILTYKLNYYQIKANHVVILDHSKYNGLEKRYVDYTISEILTLIESTNHNATCYFYLHSPKKSYYSKFLYEPLPLESLLNHFLANHINAEIVAKNIKTTQDCIDWITWTFLYRRLTQNPNFYNLSEVTGTSINNYLSELIENTIEELQEAKCLVVEEDKELDSINSGIIANYYYINVQTVALFTELIHDKSKLQDILYSLSQATEFDHIQIRNSEEIILSQLAKQLPYTPSSIKLNEPNTKAYILLQAHFSRLHLNPDLQYDLTQILEIAQRLTTAIVDVASSNLWLKTAIYSMQLSQMIIQAMWIGHDSQLKQLPYFDDKLIASLKQSKVEDIPDFMNMDDSARDQHIQHLSQQQIQDIAATCNRFPIIEISNIQSPEQVYTQEIMEVKIQLVRESESYSEFAIAPYYNKPKEESWWVLCGDKRSNRLFGNKKISFNEKSSLTLKFQAPEAGEYDMTIYAMCDSYVGGDQGKQFHVQVLEVEKQEMEEEVVVEEEQKQVEKQEDEQQQQQQQEQNE